MMLAESDVLLLDDRLSKYVPRLSFMDGTTIRQLLNHTGSLPDYGGLVEYHDEAVRRHPEAPWTTRQFFERTWGQAGVPGWRYSNIGYLELRLLIESCTEGSFRDAVSRYISTPLALADLEVVESLEDVAGLTPGYSPMLSPLGQLEHVTPHYQPGWVSHGLIVSTAADLARFLEALVTGCIVDEESLGQMRDGVPVGQTHPFNEEPLLWSGIND